MAAASSPVVGTENAPGTRDVVERAEGPEPGLRDRKKRETRSRIHRAAVELALARGTDRVTADDIALSAGVSPRTFFNYFATKEDAFAGIDPGIVERLAAAVRARPPHENAAQAVRAVVAAHLATLESDEQLWRRRRELAAREPALAMRLAGTTDAVERALVDAAVERAGVDRATDLRPALAAHQAMAAVRAAVGQHVAAGFTGSLGERLAAAFAAVDAGSSAG